MNTVTDRAEKIAGKGESEQKAAKGINVSILGAGTMARAIATRFLAGGNNVTFFARNQDKAQALADQVKPFAENGAVVKTAAFGSPIHDSVVVNTIWYNVARDMVKQHADQLEGKILVDITNPLNQTYDDLVVPPGTSAAEELQKLAPMAKVIKAFNTVFAGLLGQGNVAGLPLDVLIAGDDENAKATVAKLVQDGGLRPIDAGPLKRARQLESLALLNITLQSKMEKPWMTGVKLLG